MQKKASKSNEDLLDVYFNQIKGFPLLSFDEELALSENIQNGDEKSLHKMVNSNLRLVIKIAGAFNVPGIAIMDMIQEGNIGLIHAAKKYDFRKKVRFCTYASWWIRQFISRFIAKRRRLVRLPQRKEETLRKIQYAYHSLCQTLKHQPRSSDIAKELGIPVKEVDSFAFMTADALYYDQNSANDSICAVDVQEDYTYNPEFNLMKQVSHDGTMRILNKLKDKERRILSYRYQLNGCEHHTLREIGDKLNISPETVRQIEKKALLKISAHAKELQEYLYVEAI